jgi:hypothetical protein
LMFLNIRYFDFCPKAHEKHRKQNKNKKQALLHIF